MQIFILWKLPKVLRNAIPKSHLNNRISDNINIVTVIINIISIYSANKNIDEDDDDDDEG